MPNPNIDAALAGLQGGYPPSGRSMLDQKAGLASRASQERDMARRQLSPLQNTGIGPLPDPNWDAYLQSLKEGGITRATDTLAPPSGYKQESPGTDFSEGNNYRRNPQVRAGLQNFAAKNPLLNPLVRG